MSITYTLLERYLALTLIGSNNERKQMMSFLNTCSSKVTADLRASATVAKAELPFFAYGDRFSMTAKEAGLTDLMPDSNIQAIADNMFGATPAIGNRKPDENARLAIPVIPEVSYSVTNSKVEMSDFFRLLPETAKLYRPSGDLVFCHFDPSGKSYAPHPSEGEHWNYLEIHHSGDELLYMLIVIFRSNLTPTTSVSWKQQSGQSR